MGRYVGWHWGCGWRTAGMNPVAREGIVSMIKDQSCGNCSRTFAKRFRICVPEGRANESMSFAVYQCVPQHGGRTATGKRGRHSKYRPVPWVYTCRLGVTVPQVPGIWDAKYANYVLLGLLNQKGIFRIVLAAFVCAIENHCISLILQGLGGV